MAHIHLVNFICEGYTKIVSWLVQFLNFMDCSLNIDPTTNTSTPQLESEESMWPVFWFLRLFNFKACSLYPHSTDFTPVYKAAVPKCGTTLYFPLESQSKNQPENGITATIKSILGKALFYFQEGLVVDISEEAMHGKKKFNIAVKISNNTEHLNLQLLQNVEEKSLKFVAPLVELTGEDGGEVTFSDFVKITLPHNMAKHQIRFAEVLQTHAGVTRSLPTGLECHPEHVDAYFTVDETHITVYTKSFSTYTCVQGHSDQLVRAWVYGSKLNNGIEIRTCIGGKDSPKQQLLDLKILSADKLIWQRTRIVQISSRQESCKKDDIMAFGLEIEGTEWESRIKPVIQIKRLEDIIVCSECQKKENCPPDAAVFHVQPKEAGQIFKGNLHIVMKSPDPWYRTLSRFFGFRSSPFDLARSLGQTDVSQWIKEVEEDSGHGVTTFDISIDPSKDLSPNLVGTPELPEEEGYEVY